MRKLVFTGVLFGFLSSFALASDQRCDCSEKVGSCVGAIEFVKGYGSNGSYGAEIILHSSSSSCSKVEYYVDSTPYQTVLSSGNSQGEQLFGSSPIARDNISYKSCFVCKSADSAVVGVELGKLVKLKQIDVPLKENPRYFEKNFELYSINGYFIVKGGSGKKTSPEQLRVETMELLKGQCSNLVVIWERPELWTECLGFCKKPTFTAMASCGENRNPKPSVQTTMESITIR